MNSGGRERARGPASEQLWAGASGACARVMIGAAVLLAAVPALADDDDVPIDPTVAIPGFRLLGVLVLAAAALFVWYHLRRRAIVRSRDADRRDGRLD